MLVCLNSSDGDVPGMAHKVADEVSVLSYVILKGVSALLYGICTDTDDILCSCLSFRLCTLSICLFCFICLLICLLLL